MSQKQTDRRHQCTLHNKPTQCDLPHRDRGRRQLRRHVNQWGRNAKPDHQHNAKNSAIREGGERGNNALGHTCSATLPTPPLSRSFATSFHPPSMLRSFSPIPAIRASCSRCEQAALQADIAQMQVQVAELEKRGGRIVMTECGGRLCIEASANQGQNKDGSPAAMGSWQRDIKNGGGKVSLVIPKGY